MKKKKITIKRINVKEVIKKRKTLNIRSLIKMAQRLKRISGEEQNSYGHYQAAY